MVARVLHIDSGEPQDVRVDHCLEYAAQSNKRLKRRLRIVRNDAAQGVLISVALMCALIPGGQAVTAILGAYGLATFALKKMSKARAESAAMSPKKTHAVVAETLYELAVIDREPRAIQALRDMKIFGHSDKMTEAEFFDVSKRSKTIKILQAKLRPK